MPLLSHWSDVRYNACKYIVLHLTVTVTAQIDWNHPAIESLAIEKGWGANGYSLSNDNVGAEAKQVTTNSTAVSVSIKRKRRHDLLCSCRKLVVNDGDLWLVTRGRDNKSSDVQLKVVRQSEIRQVLHHMHDEVAHPGANQTWIDIQKQYVGIGVNDVNMYCNSCAYCLTRKSSVGPKVPHNRPIQVYNVFQRVGVDLTYFEDRRTGKGHWILSILDYFSRFGQAFLSSNDDGHGQGTARVVAQIIVRYFRQLGRCPKDVQSDNGSQFVSSVLQETMAQLGVKIIHALPKQPTTGGRYEVFHRSIKAILRAVLAEEGELHVAEALQKACFIYNNREHCALSVPSCGRGLTPLEVWQPQTSQRLGQSQERIPRDTIPVVETTQTDPPQFNEEILVVRARCLINDIKHSQAEIIEKALLSSRVMSNRQNLV